MTGPRETTLITWISIIIFVILLVFSTSSLFKSVTQNNTSPEAALTSPQTVAPTETALPANEPTLASTPVIIPQVLGEEITQESDLPKAKVLRVIDGDTIEVEIVGSPPAGGEKVRMIGINTPETVDFRKPVECFGHQASAKTKELLTGQTVGLETDPLAGERDKYGRLLRFVFLADGTNVNELLIREGFAHEYTYNLPYKYQAVFIQAEAEAKNTKRGLWAGTICTNPENSGKNDPLGRPELFNSKNENAEGAVNECPIKGNVSASGEKIYHIPGGEFYSKTQIDESKGERWFCSEEEAIQAGWRE